jgi:DNA-binding CsgD family transcriptional regulator
MNLTASAPTKSIKDQAQKPIQSKNWPIPTIGIGLLIISILTLVDVVSDIRSGTSISHLASEFVTIIICAIGAIWFLNQIKILKLNIKSVSQESELSKAEAVKWRQEAENHVKGVGAAIDKQLRVWHLTPCESAITFLMLKGLTYQEIADLRNVSERTIRQQAAAVLKKSNLNNRSELAAYFLEDLLPPDHSKA